MLLAGDTLGGCHTVLIGFRRLGRWRPRWVEVMVEREVMVEKAGRRDGVAGDSHAGR